MQFSLAKALQGVFVFVLSEDRSQHPHTNWAFVLKFVNQDKKNIPDTCGTAFGRRVPGERIPNRGVQSGSQSIRTHPETFQSEAI